MLLYWKPVAKVLQQKIIKKRTEIFGEAPIYLGIIFLWEHPASKIYVKKKQDFGEEVGIQTLVFWQKQTTENSAFYLQKPRKERWYTTISEVLELIEFLNQDEQCKGIIVQLPLPENLQKDQQKILNAITPEKDLDGMNGSLLGKDFLGRIVFLPATPKAVIHLLDYYQLWNMRGKEVVILGKGIVVGKPLALEVYKRGGFLKAFDVDDNVDTIKNHCQQADYIFSATGKTHLVDTSFLANHKKQVVIDIGYGQLHGKAVGDVNFDEIENKVEHLSPVPWGVGPLTIACLFDNLFDLYEQKDIL